jgi:hypothetical protein
MDCYSDPTHLQKARSEFLEATKEHAYKCPIPDEIKPRQYDNPERNIFVERN